MSSRDEKGSSKSGMGLGAKAFLCLLLSLSACVATINADNSISELDGAIIFVLALLSIVAFFIWVHAIANAQYKPSLEKRHRSGSRLIEVSAPERGDGDIMIGNVRVPRDKELYHFTIEGAPGSGKTQTINQILHVARERGDTVVVLDSNYELHKQFARRGDIILSPFDESGEGWSPINEVRDPSDWGSIFTSFIGEGHGDSRTWNGMAREFATAAATRYHRECKAANHDFDLTELFNLLTSASPEQVAMLVEGTSAATLATSDKALANVRMSLIEGLASWPHLKPGNFSIRDWVDSNARPSIWIPYRKRNLAVMKHLMSAWLDQMILSAIDGGRSEKRTWLIVDELGNLGEIGGLVNSTTEIRKPGFRVVTALQDFNQVVETYGKTRASTLLNNMANKVFFRVSSGDVAERMSRDLGDRRVLTVSRNIDGDGRQGYSERDEIERVVIGSEITSLPNLTAFVKLAESGEIKKTKIELYDEWKKGRS